jgi:hypothetical protein
MSRTIIALIILALQGCFVPPLPQGDRVATFTGVATENCKVIFEVVGGFATREKEVGDGCFSVKLFFPVGEKAAQLQAYLQCGSASPSIVITGKSERFSSQAPVRLTDHGICD